MKESKKIRDNVIKLVNGSEVVLCTNEECSESGKMKYTSICNPDYDPAWYKSKELSENLEHNILKLTKEFTENNAHKS